MTVAKPDGSVQESKKYTTINTHKGLYQYNRLPFGISSAPGIFQRNLENLLQGIPSVILRVDDILVGGKDDADHLSNLNAVLTRLSGAGLRLKKIKCCFMASDVTYCGYGINENGVHPVVEKVEAITKAPEPENINQLRSFLGMLNYYHRFLPNVATVLDHYTDYYDREPSGSGEKSRRRHLTMQKSSYSQLTYSSILIR